MKVFRVASFTTFEAVLEDFANFAPMFEEVFFKLHTLILFQTLLFLVLLEAFCSYCDVLLCFLGLTTEADDTIPVLEEFANFAPVFEEAFFESLTFVLPETLLILVFLELFVAALMFCSAF